MNRRIKGQVRVMSSKLTFCGMSFVFGCALGGFVSKHLGGDGYETALAVLRLTAIVGESDRTLMGSFNSAVAIYRIPFYMCAAGMTSLAPAIVPVLFLTKGFLITFFLGCFSKVLGAEGVVKALTMILPSELVSLPCLVGLGVLALAYSGGAGYGLNARDYVSGCVKYICITVLAVIADIFISPYLLSILG